MTILVQQLRERALKATPGPWQHERLGIIQGGPMQTYVNGTAMPQLFTSHGADFMEPGDYLANADFVAAANPAAVLALLDEIDRLKHSINTASSNRDHLARELRQALDGQDRLKAENAELRRDAERYRWLRDRTGYRLFGYLTCQPASIVDAEIDQAMTKEQQA